ncbi:hypothetical protein, partial [Lysobacter sp. 22409]|uniref:hypothetical protein n=1 Tax=Lysobacter sp. 22409 TaxID=3453917 RepID=UPI003F84EEBD
GIFHTGHPCPDEKRPASMQAALRVFYCLRKVDTTHGNGNGNGNGNRKIFKATEAKAKAKAKAEAEAEAEAEAKQ